MSKASDEAVCWSDRLLLSKLFANASFKVADRDGEFRFLYETADSLIKRAGRDGRVHLKNPEAIYVVESDYVAVAYLSGSGNIVFSSEALRFWSKEELAGVMGHEIAHGILDGKYGNLLAPIKAVTACSLLSLAGALIGFAAHQVSDTFSTLCFSTVASSLAYSAYNYFSRAIEYKMDRDGAYLAGSNGVISALTKLAAKSEGYSMLANLLDPHPSLESRINRLKTHYNVDSSLQL